MSDADIRDHMTTAIRIANGFSRGARAAERDEVRADALFALATAIDAYKPGRGAFAPFMKACVRNRIRKEYRRRHWPFASLNAYTDKFGFKRDHPALARAHKPFAAVDNRDYLQARLLNMAARAIETAVNSSQET